MLLGYNHGVNIVGIENVSGVKSAGYTYTSTFPNAAKEDFDAKFREYFSGNHADEKFLDLHGELQRLDLRS